MKPHVWTGSGLRRRAAALTFAALAAVAASGCESMSTWMSQWGGEDDPPGPIDMLLIAATTDKPVYRPGEAIRLDVRLTNTGDEPMLVRGLTATTAAPEFIRGSISVFFGSVREDRRVERFPVVTPPEQRARVRMNEPPVEIGPGETLDRPFILTQATRDAGEFVLQVHMSPFPPQQFVEDPTGKLYSNEVAYEVHGERLFRRDSKGMILLADADAMARGYAAGPVLGTDSVLIEDRDGTYKWWINVDYVTDTGGTSRAGFLIDTYRGVAWAAQPFDPARRPTRDNVIMNPLSGPVPPPRR